MHWRKTPYYLRRNISKKRDIGNFLKPGDLKFIQNVYKFDYQLYNYCLDSFNRVLEIKAEDFQSEVLKFKLENQKHQSKHRFNLLVKKKARRFKQWCSRLIRNTNK